MYRSYIDVCLFLFLCTSSPFGAVKMLWFSISEVVSGIKLDIDGTLAINLTVSF